MAFLAAVASHAINGVAAIHSEIIKDTIFKVGAWGWRLVEFFWGGD